jgi:HlyD family secretion protein
VVTEVGNSGITSMAGTQEEVTNFLVTVLVDEAHPGLKPGMSATVEIITAVDDSVLNVPIQSVVSRLPSELEKQEEGEKGEGSEESPKPKRKRTEREEEEEVEGVFVVTDEDQALFVPVKTSIADDLSIEVEGDLEEGQRVVSGPYKVLRTLKNGTDLKIEEEKKPSDGTEN